MLKLALALVVCLMIAPAAFGQATVITEFGCIVTGPAWGTGSGPTLFTTVSKHVESNSGNVNFYCDFDIPPANNVGGPAVKIEGFLCSTFAGLTSDTWSITDWDEGTVHLACKIRPNKP